MKTSGHRDCILVTGADRGLGLGFVRHYLGLGRTVVATSRRRQVSDELAALDRSHGERLRTLPLDVSDMKSITDFAAAIEDTGLTFEIVVGNAGVTVKEPFGGWTPETFVTSFRVNAAGPALLIQAIESYLQVDSKVILVSSGMGSLARNIEPLGSLDAYAASKCALNILARRLAEKLRPRGIAVVSVNPGWVRTDMGGPEAPTSVDDAIGEMTSTIDEISMAHAGTFIARDGSAIAW